MFGSKPFNLTGQPFDGRRVTHSCVVARGFVDVRTRAVFCFVLMRK
jgi:hypothetical protein